MFEIFNLAVPFFGLVALGALAARIWSTGEEGLAWLNIFLVYFALPALIFKVVADAPFEKLVSWPFVSATTAVTVAAFLGVYAAGRLFFRQGGRVAALMGTAGSYGNVGYMGLPLAVAFFGPQAAVPAALVFCFDCAAEFVLTPLLAALDHEGGEGAHWGGIARRVVRQVFYHPFIIATIVGVIASGFAFKAPGALETIIDMLMRAAGPCALFALGATVAMRKFAGMGPELPLLVIVKTVLQPLAAYTALQLVPGLDPVWLHVGVMMAALPTASNAFIMASHAKAFVEGASTAVIVSTCVSAVTIPLIVYMLR